MNKIPITLAISLALVSGFIGFNMGYAYNPDYSLTMYDKNQMNLGIADRWLDLRYLNAMIKHHRGAILLAEQITGDTHKPEILSLKKEILNNEPKLIAELYSLKKTMYNDTRNVDDPFVSNLGENNKTFDLRLLNALVSHHTDGIEMARDVKSKSSTSEILDNADAVEIFLTGSLEQLKQWRFSWFSV